MVLVRRESVLIGAPSLRSMPVMKLCCMVLMWCLLDRLAISMMSSFGERGVIRICRLNRLCFRGG